MFLKDRRLIANWLFLFRIAVVGKKFESVADATEKWYGTSYKQEKIAEEDLNAWMNAGLSDKLHMPPKNEFIPEQLDLVAREEVTIFLY